ncbi:unnamed protein product [Aphanomyces euteiches]|uniref:Glycine zipper domain-containing protein n=1 Tax=Aphanomyces euteiches TaxID=100861 RepID=A0A6G0W709_9STRA|nr:hypothetical protein Ae201684_017988 [Aphanomyces euteiches]KAH9074108.1 hypothetical protein Ae201684P_016006 [Aphanomyces euteiches]KAH9139767.1 hypothetical protein AeRB84_015963 [Aphanomyces euteiches]
MRVLIPLALATSTVLALNQANKDSPVMLDHQEVIPMDSTYDLRLLKGGGVGRSRGRGGGKGHRGHGKTRGRIGRVARFAGHAAGHFAQGGLQSVGGEESRRLKGRGGGRGGGKGHRGHGKIRGRVGRVARFAGHTVGQFAQGALQSVGAEEGRRLKGKNGGAKPKMGKHEIQGRNYGGKVGKVVGGALGGAAGGAAGGALGTTIAGPVGTAFGTSAGASMGAAAGAAGGKRAGSWLGGRIGRQVDKYKARRHKE